MLTNALLSLREAFVRVLDRDDREDQGGQGMVEYALILVLIAMVVLVMVTVFGKSVSNLYSNVSSGIGA